MSSVWNDIRLTHWSIEAFLYKILTYIMTHFDFFIESFQLWLERAILHVQCSLVLLQTVYFGLLFRDLGWKCVPFCQQNRVGWGVLVWVGGGFLILKIGAKISSFVCNTVSWNINAYVHFIISQHWDSEVSQCPPSKETRTCLDYVVNNMADDDLAMQGTIVIPSPSRIFWGLSQY